MAGWLIFLLLAALAYLTPARLSVMRFAGRDYTALMMEHSAREQALQALQPNGNTRSFARDQESAVARARTALADADMRIVAWARANARISPFGFLGWLSDLWPWLLGLGIGLLLFGGLIGVQIREARDAAAGRSALPVAEIPAASGVPEVHESVSAPIEPSSWSWNAAPVVRPAQPRPKTPPVKSPHGLDGET